MRNQRTSRTGRQLFSRQFHPFGTAWLRLLAGLSLLLALLPGSTGQTVKASDNPRIIKVSQVMMAHHWKLIRWANGEKACDFYIKNKGLPTLQNVQDSCTPEVYEEWAKTPTCPDAANGGKSCLGFFLNYLNQEEGPVVESIEYPQPSVSVERANCAPWTACAERPRLTFVGKEPIQAYAITAVRVRLGDEERVCYAASCELQMPLTNEQGVRLEYWAESNLGDESPHLFLTMRNRQPSANESYQLEVLGLDWSSNAPPGAVRWGLFPSTVSQFARVLEQPASASDLQTRSEYLYLAGHLIKQGRVSATGCPSWGLWPNGSANACGADQARETMYEWQNRYDAQILTAARKYDLPARLLKALIARETQFWPVSDTPYELGLGRITENGADLLLSWNLSYFLQLCGSVYGETACAGGYYGMNDAQRMMLRWHALTTVGTDQEIDLIAATLKASSNQVVEMINYASPGDLVDKISFEDMWWLSVGNYHSGSGCIADALNKTVSNSASLTWTNISQNLTPVCQPGQSYVSDVAAMALY